MQLSHVGTFCGSLQQEADRLPAGAPGTPMGDTPPHPAPSKKWWAKDCFFAFPWVVREIYIYINIYIYTVYIYIYTVNIYICWKSPLGYLLSRVMKSLTQSRVPRYHSGEAQAPRRLFHHARLLRFLELLRLSCQCLPRQGEERGRDKATIRVTSHWFQMTHLGKWCLPSDNHRRRTPGKTPGGKGR